MTDMLKTGIACLLALLLISCGGGGSAPPPPPPPPPSLTVSPSNATVGTGATEAFTAKDSTGTAVASNWSVNGVPGGSSSTGTIVSATSTNGTPIGKYSAPSAFLPGKTVTIGAASQANSSSTGNTTVSISDTAASQSVPIKLGTTGGNSTDFVDSGSTRTCCSGTLGALLKRGGIFFILSNNHVLFKSDQGASTDTVQQPGLVDNQCDIASAPMPNTVGNMIEAAALKPSPCSPSPCTGPAPSNVDAAIAQVVMVPSPTVDTAGSILDFGAASANSIAPDVPSLTLADPATVLTTGERVAKSGRSTGLTCSSLQAINANVSVQYNSSCGGPLAFTSTFTSQVVVNGGTFSASGDSGSLIVTADTARPVGLLFAGNTTSTTANAMLGSQGVIAAFTNGSGTPVVVGGGDHAIACSAVGQSATLAVGIQSAELSTEEAQRATTAKEKFASQLQNAGVTSVDVGASADNPKEGALILHVNGRVTNIPAQVGGVRTRLIYEGGPAPRATVDDINRATAIKQAHDQTLMSQPGIQGVGVGISDDNPAEPAMVIYIISGVARAQLPPTIDGLRTKIIEGDRFRAFGWGKETKPSTCSQKQSTLKNSSPLQH